jgi:hypothetical protein
VRKLALYLLLSAFVASSTFAATEGVSLVSFEGFGNLAFQDINPGGNSFAGGAHWTPTLEFDPSWAVKGMLGAQMFKSTSTTGKDTYVVLDYLAAGQYRVMPQAAVQLGGGAGTDLRSQGKTRVAVMAGVEYGLGTKLLGVFDRAVLNGHYYFNSSSLWVIHYGLGISL